ncbi:hypothetical protein [Salinibacter ruber]|uniref:hypothetical protein n=1 Tax=Salinibacter ruber TaxID=146919 RepID=UPI002169182F|nr:hypothetical protein [Salinibacter ruber]
MTIFQAVLLGVVSGFVVVPPWYDAAAFRVLFAVVLLVVAGRMGWGPAEKSRSVDVGEEDAPDGWRHWIGTGTAAGTVAAAVGVGGAAWSSCRPTIAGLGIRRNGRWARPARPSF